MTRFLAIYTDGKGDERAAMLSASNTDVLPFGVDERSLRLPDHNGHPILLIEMPDDSFRPMIVSTREDDEIPLAFVDL